MHVIKTKSIFTRYKNRVNFCKQSYKNQIGFMLVTKTKSIFTRYKNRVGDFSFLKSYKNRIGFYDYYKTKLIFVAYKNQVDFCKQVTNQVDFQQVWNTICDTLIDINQGRSQDFLKGGSKIVLSYQKQGSRVQPPAAKKLLIL